MVISEVNSFAFWGDQTLNIAQVSAASAESDSFCNSVFQRCKPQQNRCSKHGATLEKEKGEQGAKGREGDRDEKDETECETDRMCVEFL